MSDFLSIITDSRWQHWQKAQRLACAAENCLTYPAVGGEAGKMLAEGIICDIHEGPAPYRPRYTVPDYRKFLSQGSEFLGLSPAGDIFSAIGNLLAIYRFVPSITGYPVYIGQLDELLDPYLADVDESTGRSLLRMMMDHVAAVLPDAFVHANIGPRDSSIARWLLEIEGRRRSAVPNLTLKYSPAVTPPALAEQAALTALDVAKPCFANHEAYQQLWPQGYAIVSCYNALPVGGGSHTLVRLNLARLAGQAADTSDFLDRQLPAAVACLAEIINARSRFLVEQSQFYATSFLIKEGLLDPQRFTAMAGVFGLYECLLGLGEGRLGQDDSALVAARAILGRCRQLLDEQPAVHCRGSGDRLAFHAQSGIDSDVGITPGVRIRSGCEPHLFEQIKVAGELHGYFDAGVSDIYVFDSTASSNPRGLKRVIDGAMASGVRMLACYRSDADLIRITGYLVKRSDLEKLGRQPGLHQATVTLAAGAIAGGTVLPRAVRPG
ncbi:MAG: YjjI family glycine radical enzyme [Negativicutes bacterium]|nr:YjjI family glycine radical enzyme [Negativicutes bacterium]